MKRRGLTRGDRRFSFVWNANPCLPARAIEELCQSFQQAKKTPPRFAGVFGLSSVVVSESLAKSHKQCSGVFDELFKALEVFRAEGAIDHTVVA